MARYYHRDRGLGQTFKTGDQGFFPTAIRPGTIGYPDVDTYRDLYFVIEGTNLE